MPTESQDVKDGKERDSNFYETETQRDDRLNYQYYCQECGHLRDYCDCDVGVD